MQHGISCLVPAPAEAGFGTDARLWNEFIARYHYRGYTPMSGSQLRYWVLAAEQFVVGISFGASAYKLRARDNLIGWGEAQRQRNLQLVVSNARLLALPRVQSKGAGLENTFTRGTSVAPRLAVPLWLFAADTAHLCEFECHRGYLP